MFSGCIQDLQTGFVYQRRTGSYSFSEEQKHTYPQQPSKFRSWTQTVNTSITEPSGALCIGVRTEFEKESEKDIWAANNSEFNIGSSILFLYFSFYSSVIAFFLRDWKHRSTDVGCNETICWLRCFLTSRGGQMWLYH